VSFTICRLLLPLTKWEEIRHGAYKVSTVLFAKGVCRHPIPKRVMSGHSTL
jgi:hypothetical protein